MHVSDDVLRVVDWRVQEPVRSVPLSIEVTAEERAPVVAVDNAVGVKHWDNSNDEVLPQLFGVIGHEVAHQAVQHVRSLRLSWVDTARYDDRLLLAVIFDVLNQSLAEALELRGDAQEVVLVVLVELLKLFFDGRLEQLVNTPFGLLTLLRQLFDVVIFGPELLLDYASQLCLQA